MNTETKEIGGVAAGLDALIRRIADIISWLNAILVAVIVVQVILRYFFGRGLIILEEIQWHLYGVCIMIAISYALLRDSHIRLDIFHTHFSKRKKEKVEIFGIVFLLLPLIITVFVHSLDFVGDSWRINERSIAPMGLPWRWAIKSFIPIGFALLAIAAVARLIKAILFLRGNK